MKDFIIKIMCYLFIILIILFLFIIPTVKMMQEVNEERFYKKEITIDNLYICDEFIIGDVKNISNEEIKEVQVKIEYYDFLGEKIDLQIYVLNDLNINDIETFYFDRNYDVCYDYKINILKVR